MLRITRSATASSLCLTVEGRLVGPWVSELGAACERGDWDGQVVIDLAGVTFVDAAGVALLRQLAAEGCELHRCSSFVAELLRRE